MCRGATADRGLQRSSASGTRLWWGPISPRVLHFVAKAELFQNKVFGAMLRGYNSIPIQRGTRARRGLLGAEDVLNGEGPC